MPDSNAPASALIASRPLPEGAAERARAFEELAREHDTIIDSSSDGLFVCDARANVIRMNPASERIHNVRAGEIVGRNMVDLIKEGFIDRSAAYEALQSKRVVSLLQNKAGRKLISIATPVFDEQGAVIRVVVSERDITQIDTLQRELEEQEALKDGIRDQLVQMQQAEIAAQRIVAKSPGMLKAFNQALKVAPAEATVLLLGESGVGKGLFADLIHKYSSRAAQPLIKINCGAIPESLLESELFGYEKGAFTGAQGSKPGHFELADHGILFLDEIAELPLAAQVKLLRFLEDGRITRLGGTKGRTVDVRIIAATNRDLDSMVEQGRFRLDLFYRLNVIPIHVPALCERKDCILPLVRHYLDYFGERHQIRKRLTRAASDALLAYPYPGNVRELMNLCERLVLMSETELIDVRDLPVNILGRSGGSDAEFADWPEEMTLTQILESTERAALLRTAQKHPSQERAALALGVSQPTIARRFQKYGIKANGSAP